MKTRNLPASLNEEALKTVWKASRDAKSGSAGSPGLDRQTSIDFQRDLKGQIHRIREAIRHDNFSFRPLRVVAIPKKSGKRRLIAIPPVGDRLVQRAICKHLINDPKYPKQAEIAYGFVPGRKLGDAHLAALNFRNDRPWVLQTDIVSFFDQIERSTVESAVRKAVRSKVIAELIRKAIWTELDYTDPLTTSLALENGVTKGRGLRRGMPLSPMLSNLIMRPADKALMANRLKAVRYADDIAVFCESEAECVAAFELISELLKPLGLKIPGLKDGKKTIITPPGEPCELLGVEIRADQSAKYRLCIPKGRLTEVEAHLVSIATVEHCTENKIGLTRMLAHFDAVIRGHKESVKALDGAGAYFPRFDAIRERAQKNLLVSILGKGAVDVLTDEKRAVLGLMPFPA
jgi:retron-type reverse transcriptase